MLDAFKNFLQSQISNIIHINATAMNKSITTMAVMQILDASIKLL